MNSSNRKKENKGFISCLTPPMKRLMVIVFGLLGTVLSIYIGGYVMLIEPAISLYKSFMAHTLGIKELFVDIVSFSLAATVGGTVWCIFDIIAGLFREREE